MPDHTTFETFERELNRLVESFGKRLAELKLPGYAEAQLRDDFLNPFFRALGWDMENRAGLIQKEREVEIESATQIGGGRKRADYVKFTANGLSATPIRIIDFSKPADKSRHDKLVVLVDKLLGLMPKLRGPSGQALSDSDKATLQNAVTATDQQIDQLVYELYELTPEEIALVEGAA